MQDHAKRSKEWRDLKVGDHYNENEESYPDMLLYTWRDHINLVGAMFLLARDRTSRFIHRILITEVQLARKSYMELLLRQFGR
ncbi:hypothetical protein LLH06_10170 [Mucilaginibacter daejeonensis]|uniref:hypothetical protein n=1 Tax=Mucilaginibacter daejeonensis TaxID=398049 RepID=UPI001D173FEB|nr:hypothetical protein [Mucilaginibacter daejeonensis]UEG51337.1 hypothetical protein LLH06_10170 [Mucilaginibacter daejeonensis]